MQIPIKFHRLVRDYGLNGNESAHEWLAKAVYLSAPYTHPDGNRRFEDVIMRIKDNRLVSMTVFEPDCSSCHDTGVFVAIDEDGTRNEWPCPDCSIDKPEYMRESRVNRQGGHNGNKQKRKRRPRRYA